MGDYLKNRKSCEWCEEKIAEEEEGKSRRRNTMAKTGRRYHCVSSFAGKKVEIVTCERTLQIRINTSRAKKGEEMNNGDKNG